MADGRACAYSGCAHPALLGCDGPCGAWYCDRHIANRREVIEAARRIRDVEYGLLPPTSEAPALPPVICFLCQQSAADPTPPQPIPQPLRSIAVPPSLRPSVPSSHPRRPTDPHRRAATLRRQELVRTWGILAGIGAVTIITATVGASVPAYGWLLGIVWIAEVLLLPIWGALALGFRGMVAGSGLALLACGFLLLVAQFLA